MMYILGTPRSLVHAAYLVPEIEWGSAPNVSMIMQHQSENTYYTVFTAKHEADIQTFTVNTRLNPMTVFLFRVKPHLNMGHHIKLKNSLILKLQSIVPRQWLLNRQKDGFKIIQKNKISLFDSDLSCYLRFGINTSDTRPRSCIPQSYMTICSTSTTC